MKKTILIFLTLFFIFAAFFIYIFHKKTSEIYDGHNYPVKIEIKRGSSVSSISRILSKNKIISNYLFFKLYYKLFHRNTVFMSGEYLFDSPVSMKDVIEKMKKGDIFLYKFTIKEGMTIDETAKFLERSNNIDYTEFIEASKTISLINDIDNKATDLEGYLFPETYFISKGTNSLTIVKTMVNRFKKNFSESYRWRAKELGMTVRNIVTLASLIEKETASRDERFLISSVFHNRLKIGMPLGCDPTVIYALKLIGEYTGKLRWKDLKIDSPYNTRINRGLPPGPICSPGVDSIEAALFPEKTEFLYFVAKDSRTHYFSKTLKEHNWAVRKYILKESR